MYSMVIKTLNLLCWRYVFIIQEHILKWVHSYLYFNSFVNWCYCSVYIHIWITSAIFYAALLMSVVKRFVKKNKMSTGPMPWTSKRTYSINKNSNTSELIRNQMRLFDWKKTKHQCLGLSGYLSFIRFEFDCLDKESKGPKFL